jgi:hypothetical protein
MTLATKPKQGLSSVQAGEHLEAYMPDAGCRMGASEYQSWMRASEYQSIRALERQSWMRIQTITTSNAITTNGIALTASNVGYQVY